MYEEAAMIVWRRRLAICEAKAKLIMHFITHIYASIYAHTLAFRSQRKKIYNTREKNGEKIKINTNKSYINIASGAGTQQKMSDKMKNNDIAKKTSWRWKKFIKFASIDTEFWRTGQTTDRATQRKYACCLFCFFLSFFVCVRCSFLSKRTSFDRIFFCVRRTLFSILFYVDIKRVIIFFCLKSQHTHTFVYTKKVHFSV